MRILSEAELLQREAAWLREIALRTRQYTAAIPDLDAEERRGVRKAVLHAWIRYRYPVVLLFVTNYVAIAVTAIGMAAASAAAGGAVAVLASNGGGSASAPWWLYPVAIWAAVCLGIMIVSRGDLRLIASLFRRDGIRGTARRIASGQIGYWFIRAGAVGLVAVTVAAVWLTVRTALSVPAGPQWVTAAAGLFGAVLGLSWGRWILTVQELLRRRYRAPHRPRPLDGALVELTRATAACCQARAGWWDPRYIKIVRRRLGFVIEAVDDTLFVRRRTSFTEFAVRRQARRFQVALAELIRRHDRALTRVRTVEEYDAVTASLRAGVLCLAAGDVTALMEHSAAEPPASRAARFVRRTGSALVLTAFALVIPSLPGVDSHTAAGVRVLLLMTAALSLTSANDLASSSVRSGLERSLFSKATE